MKTATRQTTVLSPPACLWMQAGVVSKKNCQQDFECVTCRFDKALRRVSRQNRSLQLSGESIDSARGRIVFWKERLKRQPPSSRPCVHHMKGRIDFRACHLGYNCSRCEFDQYFNDQFSVHTVVTPVDYLDIQGVRLPFGYYLHQGHTWVSIEANNEVRIGIDDFALRMLGRPDGIRAPLLGKQVFQGQEGITVLRGDHRTTFLSPVSGIVTAVNQPVVKDADLSADSAYSHGWIVRILCKNLRQDLANLLFMDEAKAFLQDEIDTLYRILEERTGIMAADGGSLCDDIFGNAPQLSWDQLTRTFIEKGG